MTEIRQATPLNVPNTEALRYLPEGPYPIGPGRFSWVGIQHGAEALVGSLNLYDLETGFNESIELPGRPGFAIPCQTPNQFVVGCERSLGIIDLASGRWQPFCEGIDDDVDNTIINHGMVFQDNLIFGTKDLEFATRKAGLYLYRGADQKLFRLRDDQICSNGKAMLSTDDGLRLIDIDSPTRTVVRYRIDIQGGTLGLPDTVLDLTGDSAVPDGAILTPDGSGLIVSMFHGEVADHGETRLYDIATGTLRCVWQTPGSPQNTCPALVRYDGALKLIITTAVEQMSQSDQQACPNAGKLFIGDTDFEDDGQPLAPVFPM
jgi:sugar lactone lactonase YvrE